MEVENAERDVDVGWVETKKKENAASAAVVDDDVNINNNEHAKFQASAARYVRSTLFWDLTQRRAVILCRSCGLNIGVVPKRRCGTLSLSLRCIISQSSADLNNNHDFHNCDMWPSMMWPRQRNRKRDVFNGCHIVDVRLSVYVTDM
jgi:hypothetical protein